jgi:predicted RNA methylase
MEWNDNGTIGKITAGQLDRKLYVEVNKALESMGGVWNRKVGGHVFMTDPRSSVENLVESGCIEIEKDGFFRTPIEVVRRMTEIVKPTGNVLEPSAGDGAIADRLPVFMDRVLCIEKNELRCKILKEKGYLVHCGDFLEYDPDYKFDTIFMNPPFEQGQDIDHVKHAFKLLRVGGSLISVMSEGTFFRMDSKADLFREWAKKYGGNNEKLPGEAFKESGTMVNTRLFWIKK